MKSFRKLIFWLHLIAGLTAGIVIFIMCVTGALLSFERNIIEFSERDSRYVSVNGSEANLPVSEVLKRVIEARPGVKPASLAITNEPGAAWQISLGREGMIFADPFTGEITGEGNRSVRGAMSGLRDWHRWVALSGDQRAIGKAITGASNLLFLFIAISGIYIWVPRVWAWRSFKPVLWFRGGLRGKARNFNWHNTIGFWTSLFLIVFTLTATVISYQWAGNLLYTITGNEVPPVSPPQQGGPPQAEPEFALPENLDTVWTLAEAQAPDWKVISLRLPVTKNAAVFTIDEGIYWNIFGRSTLTADTSTAAVTKWDPYGDRNAAQQLRSWFRFTHTGETGGLAGQIIGFIACVGGAFLVWTGFSLVFRRFGNWLKRRRNGEMLAADQ
ncbi:MAG TPA: PepSY-associated TM helix domain-containing protein [Pyrinomonadaceae bacterium]|nr:PepSY-associated TM helix domain-containing protein [Pyrinomonadaceae bacterium]